MNSQDLLVKHYADAFVVWIVVAALLYQLTEFFYRKEKKSRGKGSWTPHLQLLRLQGAVLALSLVALALALDAFVSMVLAAL